MKKATALFVAILLSPVGEGSVARAEMARANVGAYAGVEVGFAIAPEVTLKSTQNNAIVDTRCDLHFAGKAGFPETAADYQSFEYAAGRRCSDPVEDFWLDEFGENSVGVMASLVLGYRRVAGLPLRAEMEYFYRNNGFDAASGQTPQTGTAANKDAEFLAAFGKLNDVGRTVCSQTCTSTFRTFRRSGHTRVSASAGRARHTRSGSTTRGATRTLSRKRHEA